MYCTRYQGLEKTCWADTAWGECGFVSLGICLTRRHSFRYVTLCGNIGLDSCIGPVTLVMQCYISCRPNGGGGGQGAYNLIMDNKADVRIQYKLREGCGKLKPQQCLADDERARRASTAFQGTACTAILRTAICTGDTERFRTCAGQGQCACPAAGEPGHAKGAVWGLSSNCSGAGCQAGCAADGQSFTGGALKPQQLSDLATSASDGEGKLVQAMDKLLAHIGGTGVMSSTNLQTQSSKPTTHYDITTLQHQKAV